MQAPEPCWVIDLHTACVSNCAASYSAGPGRHLRAPGLHCLPLLRGTGRRLPGGEREKGVGEEERRGWRPGRAAAVRRTPMRGGVGKNLHAVVMRWASVSVPSLVTPGRSAPPPRPGPGSASRPRGPSGQSFLQRTLLVDAKTCLYCDPFPNLFVAPTPP